MTRRKLIPPPPRPDAEASSEAYRKWVDDLSIWREGTLAILPKIRQEQKAAAIRGEPATVEKLEREYQEIVKILAQS